MSDLSAIEQDLAAVARIDAVPTILKTIREVTGLRFTLVARVSATEWTACAVYDDIEFGLKAGGTLDVATTLCKDVHANRKAVAMDHASQDPEYCGHPTPKMYGFESYISVPLYRQNGEFFGTLCGLDPDPHTVTDEKTRALFALFSKLISLQLAAEDRHREREAELDSERKDAHLREEFIAVLGHDVRNPLNSIVMGTDLLLVDAQPQQQKTLERIRSSARRIGMLVDDVLDLARGRLGGGISIEKEPIADFEWRVRHLVAEIQSANPTRPIRLNVANSAPIVADIRRLDQLVSNLLANAVSHGQPGSTIGVLLEGDETSLVFAVSNSGSAIDAETKSRLFQPYFRGGRTGKGEGLGLGLFIVSEIARAHGGRVDVSSNDESTTFTLRMPRGAGANVVSSS